MDNALNDEIEGFGFGCLKSPYDVRDYVLANANISEDLPDKYIIDNIIVKNQGKESTCTAHALAEIVEYHNYKDTNQYLIFSTEFIYGFRNIDFDNDYLGEGMYLRDALKIIQKYGDVLEKDLPGNHNVSKAMKAVKSNIDSLKILAYDNRISTYYKTKTIDEIKYSLVNYGPVAAGMRWYKGCRLSKQNILQYDKSKEYTGHAILIIGYDNEGFIAQNSWGSLWGNNGKFKLPWADFSTLVFEAYGITDDIKAVKRPMETSKILSATINMITNVFIKGANVSKSLISDI